MSKKLILDFDLKDEYGIIAISYHQPDYRLSFFLNKNLNLRLLKCANFQYTPPQKHEAYAFSLSHCSNTDMHMEYYLLSNRNKDGILFPQYRQADYFLIICGINILRQMYKMNDSLDEIISGIKQIPNLLTAWKLDLDKTRNINFLLCDLEVHMIEKK